MNSYIDEVKHGKEATEKPSVPRRVGRAIGRNAARGGVGIGMGPTAFVAVAATEGLSRKERSKLNAKVAGASSLIVGGLVAGIGQGILERPKHGHADWAMKAQDFATNTWNWLGVAGVLMVGSFLSNRRGKQKLLRQAQNASVEAVEIDE
jgi:MFS family permease